MYMCCTRTPHEAPNMPLYSETRQPEDALHALLLRAVPFNEHGHKTIASLAAHIPCRRLSVNKWIKSGRLPPDKALRIVEISKTGAPYVEGGRVKIEELHPFVYKGRSNS